LEHSKRNEILSDIGITAQNIARSVVEWSSSFKEEMQPHADEKANRTQNH
jgi:1-deoxy-D-xylulose-5-phosphate synthase